MDEHINFAGLIEDYFNDRDFKFDVREMRDGDVMFVIPLGSKNLPGIRIRLVVTPEGICKIFTYLANEVPEKKRIAMLETLNKLENKYRYVKLTLDSDGDVLASYDFIALDDEEVAIKQVEMMLSVIKNVMDTCVPAIMRLVWEDEDDED